MGPYYLNHAPSQLSLWEKTGVPGENPRLLAVLTMLQSRRHSPQSSLGGIVGLWENAEENQPLIGCLIISLTHSLLIEMRAILITQEAKYKLVYLTRLL